MEFPIVELKYKLPESEYRELFTVSSECLRQIMEYYIDLLRKSLGETIYLQPPALVARPFLRPERNRLNWGDFLLFLRLLNMMNSLKMNYFSNIHTSTMITSMQVFWCQEQQHLEP